MLANGQVVTGYMDQMAPRHMAEPDDRIGLQLGTLRKDISKVLVTLDVTDAVVDEAIQIGANLIIAHHAIIFKPLAHLGTDSPAGRLYEKLIKHDIAVYIAHTNLDVAEGGVNDMMADALGLTERTHLQEVRTEKLKKLVVFVPETHHEAVQHALFQAGAGWIGNYSHCSFMIEGTGTFMPEAGAEPFIGKQGKLEKVREVRVETIVPESIERKAVSAMLKAHPYEEVAYDLYPMDLKGRTFGLGRVGKLREPVALAEFVDTVKRAFDVPAVRVVGDPSRMVRKIAVLGGAGRSFMRAALFAGADVYVTGDIDYHTAHDALAAGMAIIDPGHNAEKILKVGVASYLNDQLRRNKYTTEAVVSAIDTEVFRFM